SRRRGYAAHGRPCCALSLRLGVCVHARLAVGTTPGRRRGPARHRPRGACVRHVRLGAQLPARGRGGLGAAGRPPAGRRAGRERTTVSPLTHTQRERERGERKCTTTTLTTRPRTCPRPSSTSRRVRAPR